MKRRIGVKEIYTNGLLVTEQILHSIRELGILPRFQISFDGLGGGHEYMRMKAGIEKSVVNAVRIVKAAGFPTIVATSP